MKMKRMTALAWTFASVFAVSAGNVTIQSTTVVGDGIVEYVPTGFDQEKTPSLILKEEPVATGNPLPADWELEPDYTFENGKASVSLKLTGDVSLYGGGEVTGPLLRNGQYVKMWNTDNGAYGTDNGKRLYQTHPWVLGVRRDGTAFGVIFDTSWKAELYTNSDEIKYNTEGALFRTYIIDRESPQAVLQGLAELTGTIQMPPRWTLGWHQCRFSYQPDSRVREVADTFREKNIPCDVIWMDIDYMRGYRVFTFDPNGFPDPRALNDDLHKKGFRAVYMIDPGVKYEPNAGYDIFDSGMEHDVWLKTPENDPRYAKSEYIIGDAWPGPVLFPDFTAPHVQEWWAGLYKDFLAMGMDGVWNDVNEPQVNCIHPNPNDLNEKIDLEGDENRTLPYATPHRGGGNLPAGSHLLYHNAYGRLMVEASLNGIMAERPDKRPFLLTRSNLLGGQRFAATWTGDNYAADDQMRLSVPMSITLGLSGQPFNGPDIGGFLGNTSPELFGNWIGFGVFLPFSRGHACAGTNDKEPWAFGEEVETAARMAIERRYRLIPYLYTLFYESSQNGMPIMQPVFFDNPTDLRLRAEQEAFLMGKNLLVIPAFAKNPMLPSGIWEDLSLVEGDMIDKYQAKLRVKGGSIIPAGRVVQNTNENSFEPLTLIVCLDEEGKAEGQLYLDAGDGWAFKCGDYAMLTFVAERDGNVVDIKLAEKEGERNINKEIKRINAEVLLNGKVYKASGSLKSGVKVSVK